LRTEAEWAAGIRHLLQRQEHQQYLVLVEGELPIRCSKVHDAASGMTRVAQADV